MRNSYLNKLLEELRKLVLTEEGLKQVTEVPLNWIIQKEREYFFRNQKESDSNKTNGYYTRSLASLFDNLNLSVPRNRNGLFRPAILPEHWKRADGAFQDFILNLILQSYSPSRLKALLRSLNLPYSPQQIDELKDELYRKARELRSR